MTYMTRAIAILVLLCPALASASPAYPFDELLRRSETVFTCEMTARTSPVEF